MVSQDDFFSIYDLQIEVIGDPSEFVCSHKPGLAFQVEGENLVFQSNNSQFSMYSLAALMPLLPAKQRETHENDWMTTDAEIACPDPYCKAKFKITRTARRAFRHSAVTKVPLIKVK